MNITVSQYQYRGKDSRVSREKEWRVISNRLPVMTGFRTKVEAEAAADAYRKKMTLSCPSCGTNVIRHACGMSYIDGRPMLLCLCGEWVSRIR